MLPFSEAPGWIYLVDTDSPLGGPQHGRHEDADGRLAQGTVEGATTHVGVAGFFIS
jgi:hypothetical protein